MRAREGERREKRESNVEDGRLEFDSSRLIPKRDFSMLDGSLIATGASLTINERSSQCKTAYSMLSTATVRGRRIRLFRCKLRNRGRFRISEMEKPRSPKFRHRLQTMAPRTAIPRRLERSVRPTKKASESGTTILPRGECTRFQPSAA